MSDKATTISIVRRCAAAAGIAAVTLVAPAVAVVEGWRGEVVHCLETGSDGALVHYKAQDPSL